MSKTTQELDARHGRPHIVLFPSWYPTDYFPVRGSFFQEQAQALKEEGARVGVIYADMRSYRTLKLGKRLATRFQISECIEHGVVTYRFHGWNPLNARIRKKLTLKLTKRMWRIYTAKWGRPDIIHAHSAIWGGIAARAISQQTGVPYMITEHSSGFTRGLIRGWQQKAIKDAIGHASTLITVSRSLKQILQPYLHQNASNVVVIPNMVDTSFFAMSPNLRIPHPFRFLTVAFLSPNKGIDNLLKAFALVFKNNPDVALEIGGDGPQRQQLEQRAAQLGIENQVTFLGYLSREAVRDAMWRANAFVLPSYVETFGIVLVEAMATGLPVIGTRSGGPEEIITPTMGILVQPGDVQALSEALEKIRQQRNSFAPAVEIRNIVIQKYSKKTVIEQLMNIYHQKVER